MVSVSSSRLIRDRTLKFCKEIKNWKLNNDNVDLLEEINRLLYKEYEIIPEKERIGKGAVYVSKFVSKAIFEHLNNLNLIDENYVEKFIQIAFQHGSETDSMILKHFALLFLAEYVLNFPQKITRFIPLIESWLMHEDWDVRETILWTIINALKKTPNEVLELLMKWSVSDNEYLRRAVSEALRPKTSIKWLRDPSKNDKVLEILTILNKDQSMYVRKSVGNNLKDLTKYMPEKILELMEQWIKNENIKVHDELASEVGLSKEQKNLIWTIKHAMRWIKNKNPELHPRLEKILGKNYVLYFDEKRNRLAKIKR
ncbi:MAG: DNA alkylation repair protein [Candidatus Helarchaeota archaeon]